MKLAGRTAVVTGAASGIGRGIALALAKHGCNLALADVSEQGLAGTARLARAHNVKVTAHRLDVADREAVAGFPEEVLAQHGRVDLLFNNAGVAIGGTFEQVAEEDFEWLFEINFWGVVRMTRAFLPHLRQSDDARIVNVSSLFGLIAPPGQTAYSASKFAVRAFSESLRREFEAEGASVGVSVVHPGGVATSIAASAREPKGVPADELERRRKQFSRLLVMPPERAGEIIVEGVEQRRPRIMVGRDAKAMALIERVAPVSYWKLLARRISQ